MVRHLKRWLATLTFLLVWIWICGPASAAENQHIPLSVRRVLYQAQSLIEKNDLEKARIKLESFRSKKQRSHYLLEFTLGDIAMRSAAYPQASEAYHRALKLNPGFAPAWMNLGKAAYEMADYLKAADCFHRAYRTAANPHPERLYYSATAYLMAAKPQQGLQMFQALLAKHPAAVELEWKPALVQLYLALDRPLDALPVIEELAEQSAPPKKAQWQETLIGQYLQLGKVDQALAYARRLTRTAPMVPRWWKALAHILLERQDYEAALEALVIYTKLTAPGPAEKRLLADLNLQVGIPAVAVRYYRKLPNSETDPLVITRLARALRQLDRRDEALQAIERGLDKQADKDLLWLKGDLLYEMKSYVKAAAAYRRCAVDSDRAGRAWLMAGYASLQAGNTAAAQEELTRAKAYPDQEKSARAALRELKNIVSRRGS
jgi:tetratricopeptide (TPR) repeat protein